MEDWSLETWVAVLGAVGVVVGWVFSLITLRRDIKSRRDDTEARRISNLLDLIHNHRELWSLRFQYPSLRRVLDLNVDLKEEPITPDEASFMNMAIQHLNGAYEARKTGLVLKQEGLHLDIASIFSRPIPKAVWQQMKVYHNEDFVAFVEEMSKAQ